MLTVLVIVIAGLVLGSLVQPVFGTRTDFSIYNTRWNGASDLARDVYGAGLVPAFSLSAQDEDVTIVHRSFLDVDPPPSSTTILVIGPSLPPTSAEAAWLRAFVREGGRLLVADDFGKGNAFLSAVGAETRFSEERLLDLSYARRPAFVVAAETIPSPLTAGVEEVVLDHATSLVADEGVVLLRTGASAWLDTRRNSLKDDAEPTGPFPLLVTETLGAGEVVVLSDPSALINGVRRLGSNEALVLNLVAWASEGGREILIDESHREYTDPARLLGATLRALPEPARIGLSLLGAALFLGFTVARPGRAFAGVLDAAARLVRRILRPEPAQPVDLVERVKDSHPDWDENTLRRILLEWKEKQA